MTVELGDTFIIPQTAIGSHLFIVISNPIEDEYGVEPPQIAVVPVTTKRPYHKNPCVLSEGDHPFINRESIINFAAAITPPVKFLTDYCLEKEPIDAVILQRILSAADSSDDIPLGILEIMQEQGIV